MASGFQSRTTPPRSKITFRTRCFANSRSLGRWHRAHLRANDEPHIERRLEREASAPPRHDVHGPAGVRPESELSSIHPELAAGNLADLLVHAPQLEFAHLKAHGSAAVAASARLMEHDGAVCAYQLLDQSPRRQRDTDALGVLGELIVQASPPR